MSNDALASLKKKGHRLTQVRSFIVEFLSSNKKPVDVATLQGKLEKAVKKVNKTTVYREIEFLLSVGVIKSVNFGDGKNRYEIAGLPHHHHLVCSGCEKVEDVILKNELERIEKKIAKMSTFIIEKHTLEFFGKCSGCMTK